VDTFIAQGRLDEARTALQRLSMHETERMIIRRARLEAAAGSRLLAHRLLATLTEIQRQRNLPEIAAVLATCGDADAALGLLEEASARRSLIPNRLLVPEFDQLRSDLRFYRLLKATGLPSQSVALYLTLPEAVAAFAGLDVDAAVVPTGFQTANR
jgi:hypothetical protein